MKVLVRNNSKVTSSLLKSLVRLVSLSIGVGVVVDVLTSPDALAADEDFEARFKPEIVNGQRIKPQWELDSETAAKYQRSFSTYNSSSAASAR